MPDDSPMFRMGPKAAWPTAELGNRTDILMADIPAGGKLSARAVARMYAALLGEVDGVRLVSPERLRQLSAVAFADVDQVMGFPTRWGLGFGIGLPGTQADGPSTAFGVGGVGGSYAGADTATGIAFALTKKLTKNRLTADFGAAEQVAGIVTKAAAER